MANSRTERGGFQPPPQDAALPKTIFAGDEDEIHSLRMLTPPRFRSYIEYARKDGPYFFVLWANCA